MTWRKYGGWIALGVLTLAALVYGFWPQPVLVEAVAATRGPLQVTVLEEGKTRVRERYVISAPVAGYARRIEMHVGDGIAREQVLLELEPMRSAVLDPRSRAEAQARVAAAEAALAAAQQRAQAAVAEAEYARTEYKRIGELCTENCASKDEQDRAAARARMAEANQRSAEFNVEVARHDLNAARTALRYSAARDDNQPRELVRIKAPIAGRVLKIPRESEGVVVAGQALMEIGNPRALEVEVDVLSDDAVRIKPGMRVLFERWGGEPALEGSVRTVEPVGFTKVSSLGVEEQRVLVIADLTSPPEVWERLGDGYRVEARFVLWEGADVLQIPQSALFKHGEGWAVFALNDGRAVLHGVDVGQRNGLYAQILAGLQAGDQVITHPDASVDDGTRVRVR
jgi:HlyD family secretion protein